MHRPITMLAIAGLLMMSATGCVTAPTVTETRAELTRAADALDRLPRGRDLDFLAAELERLDDGARICRGR